MLRSQEFLWLVDKKKHGRKKKLKKGALICKEE
jgi:hypothetical protein